MQKGHGNVGLHRTALGKGPVPVQQFFQLSTADRVCIRSGSVRHKSNWSTSATGTFWKWNGDLRWDLFGYQQNSRGYYSIWHREGFSEITPTISKGMTGGWMRRLEGNILSTSACICASTQVIGYIAWCFYLSLMYKYRLRGLASLFSLACLIVIWHHRCLRPWSLVLVCVVTS